MFSVKHFFVKSLGGWNQTTVRCKFKGNWRKIEWYKVCLSKKLYGEMEKCGKW